jgi:putative pyruvate formate lyase activating enzyme
MVYSDAAQPGSRENRLHRTESVAFFKAQMEDCNLCPRRCGVNRTRGETGFCGAGSVLRIASHCLHTGEEPPISGKRGSGTIFFSHCNMACVYCQNYPISQLGYGNDVDVADLSGMMIELQHRGAHNVNLVTPSHFLPLIVEAALIARKRGLSVPIVYNSSGYERAETVRMLDGIIQVYLVDMRYSDSAYGLKYSMAPDYPHHNRRAVKAMVQQVGPLLCKNGLAERGVVVRHLLIPSLISQTRGILGFIRDELPKGVPVSLMSQYFPANRASEHPEVDRRLTRLENEEALRLLKAYGLERGWTQDPYATGSPVA